MSNKYLEKIASAIPTMLGSGLIGAGLGAGIAYDKTENKKKNGMRRAILGGTLGGIAGAATGKASHDFHKILNAYKKNGGDNFYRRNYYEYDFRGKSGNHFRGAGRSISDLHRDLNMPKGGFKTKKEATTHFRRQAAKHHPDRGGSTEKMQELNNAWKHFKSHPDGFEKLAKLVKQKIEEKKMHRGLKYGLIGAGTAATGVAGYYGAKAATKKIVSEVAKAFAKAFSDSIRKRYGKKPIPLLTNKSK